jgi:hypothetical protein
MAKNMRFLPDRFDEVPQEEGYVGIRRARRSKTFWLVPTAIVAGVSVILIVIGMVAVQRADDRLQISPEEIALAEPDPTTVEEVAPEPEPEPEPVEPIINPTADEADGLTITILNGTDTTGLAARAGNLLDREGWPEQTRTNADEQGVTESLVAYQDPEDEALALGVGEILGISQVVQTDNYPGARITVLVGSDFTGN